MRHFFSTCRHAPLLSSKCFLDKIQHILLLNALKNWIENRHKFYVFSRAVRVKLLLSAFFNLLLFKVCLRTSHSHGQLFRSSLSLLCHSFT